MTVSCCLALPIGCSIIRNEPFSRTEFHFGTAMTLTYYSKTSQDIYDQVFERMAEIERKMSLEFTDSEVSVINSLAGLRSVRVSEETFYVIERGLYFSELLEGRFDISVGPLVTLWNIGSQNQAVPRLEEIENRLKLVDYQAIRLEEEEQEIFLATRGMMLDLGGIGKGYAADVAASILREGGVSAAIVDIGGNIFVVGVKPDGSRWRIGIQNPDKPRGEYCGILEIVSGTVVTSGIYERCFTENGKIYHHIFDTATGFPVVNSLLSVTVVANSSISADALSTGLFSLGLRRGMELAEDLENVEAIFIDRNLGVYLTSGIESSFTLSDPDFSFAGQ